MFSRFFLACTFFCFCVSLNDEVPAWPALFVFRFASFWVGGDATVHNLLTDFKIAVVVVSLLCHGGSPKWIVISKEVLEMGKLNPEVLFEQLKSLIDAHITLRLVEFYQALVQRDQVPPIRQPQEGVTVDCKADQKQP